MSVTRESMEFDVVIVGAGPAGLSFAIHLLQLAKKNQQMLNIAVLEKGAEVGAHLISGAVLDVRALNELLPDWQQKNVPTHTAAVRDEFAYLTSQRAFRLPTPPQMRNHGNYIISLSQWGRFLATEAEALGANIFPGFAAVDVLYENDRVVGVVTDDKGLDKASKPTNLYQPGIELRAKYTVFSEGCRGSLTETILKKFDLRRDADPQTYGLGIKEVWEIDKSDHQPGAIFHSVGWPLDNKTYGGAFMYHFGENLLSVGFVVGLDYRNPYLRPFNVFQQFKTHPRIAPMLSHGKRIAYGARTLVEGGYQSLPKLTFPGGLIVGDAAGFLDVPKIKGIHNAMKSGMLAADSIFAKLQKNEMTECVDYSEKIKTSWIGQELYRARNIRPAMHYGLHAGLLYAAFDTYILRGLAPWTLHHKLPDHLSLDAAKDSVQLTYPASDNKVTFDLMSSVYLTRSNHDESQPCHLKLKNESIAIDVNYNIYASPETRYCPAGVYEIVRDEKEKPKLQINAANCVHCKACDIKDPKQNIVWTPPEGGSGPQYGIT